MKKISELRISALATSFCLVLRVAATESWTDELSLFHPTPAEGATNETATTDQPQQRRRGFGRFGARFEGVYKTQLTPHWFAHGSVSPSPPSTPLTRRPILGEGGGREEGEGHIAGFWYRNDLRGGEREFIVVDAERGTRQRAFDHEAVAKQIGGGANPARLPVDQLAFSDDGARVTLIGPTNKWVLDLKSGEFREGAAAGRATNLPTDNRARPTARTGDETQITFDNRLYQEVDVFWLDENGGRQPYGSVEPRSTKLQHTYGGHVWLIADQKGETLAVFEATDQPGVAVIGAKQPEPERTAPRERRRRETANRSPDGKWTALVKERNVFIRGESGDEIQLSKDGEDGNAYGRLEWSPDSKALAAWRIQPGERKEVYLIRSSPPGGGRAQIETRPYAQAGDRFTRYELNLFDVTAQKQIKPEVEPIEHEWLTPTLHWTRDGQRFSVLKVDRGHQRLRVIEVDVRTGATRNLIDEKGGGESPSPPSTPLTQRSQKSAGGGLEGGEGHTKFIWTAHAESLRLELVNWLEKSDEIIYVSEQDGWRHLYLVDASGAPSTASARSGTGRENQRAETVLGAPMRQITKGEWVVRGIERIDEDARQIWFTAGGKHADQDPYFLHYYCVNFDGSGLVALTEGDGNHTVQFSPDRKFIIDTYSRPDVPPVNELRRVADGQLVCKLEEADISELKANGFQPPEVFVAKGRDGNTDIWGLIHRPKQFDAKKKYPVIESIYAGPQGAFVPKSFSGGGRFSALTDLGFVVVQIDGMGTANRSKAFHDVCWKNLKDGGFADRILWMKSAAAKHPELDITRVGVYGNSAGGQNAAAAVLFHPEFYKAAVASCGCHDNRLDKASWNEQWMGYLRPDKIWSMGPDNWYSQCSNIDNAYRLQGKLFLIVGETDHNVPPESTLRFADALIKANKDFDLLVIPGGDHGMGGDYGERRMRDFFVRNLLDTEPPNRNASTETPAGN